MDFTEFKNFYDANKDSEELKGLFPAEPRVTPEVLSGLVASDAGIKSWLDSEKDKHTSKAIETWKSNNLNKLVEDKINELYPQADPKDLALKELQARLNSLEEERKKEALKNRALIEGKDSLPSDLIPFLIGENENQTVENVQMFLKVLEQKVSQVVAEKLKDTYKPEGKPNEITSNPWAKETFNLTKQGEIYKQNKDLARQLAAQAGKKIE